MKRLFVGGYPGSGSRVCQMIAKRAGYNIGQTNEVFDFGGNLFAEFYNNFRFKNDMYLREYLHQFIFFNPTWCLKHGHMMYMIPTLKRWFPNTEFILTVRHPLDNVTNKQYHHHVAYGGLSHDCSVEEHLQYYSKVHFEALKHTDYIFKLEDFCDYPEESIRKFLEFLGVDDDPLNYVDIIKTPPTIGRGKEYYGKINDPIIQRLGY